MRNVESYTKSLLILFKYLDRLGVARLPSANLLGMTENFGIYIFYCQVHFGQERTELKVDLR